MNRLILLTMMMILLFTCQNINSINREKLVDKKRLTGRDYRLFQSTPAWELAKAVQDEDIRMINEIISKEPNLIDFQESKYGETLLMLTIMNQQLKSFKALLANKADISIYTTYNGSSALIEACDSKHYNKQFAEILIENGANINDVEVGERREGNTTRFTPLIAASRQGMMDVVKLLVNNNVKINYENEYKQSALSAATMQNNYKVVCYLLQNGADYKKPIFYRPDKNRQMYLVDVLREDFFALKTNEYKYKMKIVKFLKSKGIDYKSSPIPDYIKEKAQEKYPKSWQEYLEKY